MRSSTMTSQPSCNAERAVILASWPPPIMPRRVAPRATLLDFPVDSTQITFCKIHFVVAASLRRRNHSLRPDFRRTFAAVPFALRKARRAQINSVANIANPAATIGKPGPGSTTMTNPISMIVPPIRAIKNFFTVYFDSLSRLGCLARRTICDADLTSASVNPSIHFQEF